MIFIDASELRTTSRLRKLLGKLYPAFNFPDSDSFLSAVSTPDLEARTGADLMLSQHSYPLSTDALLQMHVDGGALLIQLKFGNDLASSFGTRLHEAIHRMYGMHAKHHQCVLLFVGAIGCSRTGVLQINGRQSVPKRNYQAYHTAIRHWNRFGVVHQETREVHLAATLKNLERGLTESPRTEFWPTPPTMDDFTNDIFTPAAPVKDWRLTIATIPGVGPKRATELKRVMDEVMEGAGEIKPELISVLQWITATKEMREQMHLPKIPLWGPKTYDACRRWVLGEEWAWDSGYGLAIDFKRERADEKL